MLKKLLREMEKLEQQKFKKEAAIKDLQADIAEIDEELKKYIAIKKQYEKLETSINELMDKK